VNQPREVATEQWEGRSADRWAAAWGAPAVHLFGEVGSTSDVARRLAAGGAAAGTIVLAELQTAGRGRAGRRWESPAGSGVWFSVVVRPSGDGEAEALPIVLGLLVAACLDRWSGVGSVGIKWPNDLVIGGRKVAGILCEGSWNAGRGTVIAGIGVNVRPLPPELPSGLREVATALDDVSSAPVDRGSLAHCVVGALLQRIARPLALTPDELDAFAERDVLRGCAARVTEPTSGAPLAEGTAMGVDPAGALLLRDSAGVLRRIHSGTVRLA
jgi:BirA family transcriptional regulator, biotin operon repressor / biotin---[acetyl-CoA-carboxylase] ligase